MAKATINNHKIPSDIPQAKIIEVLYHASITLSVQYTAHMPRSCLVVNIKT